MSMQIKLARLKAKGTGDNQKRNGGQPPHFSNTKKLQSGK